MLRSSLFAKDARFEKCLVQDSAHIVPGSKGFHVSKIQYVLMALDHFYPAASELRFSTYGPTTARGVLKYKRKRKIINPAYQTTADNIVGKMTIARMDAEMLVFERLAQFRGPIVR